MTPGAEVAAAGRRTDGADQRPYSANARSLVAAALRCAKALWSPLGDELGPWSGAGMVGGCGSEAGSDRASSAVSLK